MRKVIQFFIDYPIWVNVVKILIMVFGAIALLNMKSSFFAELPSNNISISVVYPGASPEEIELGVVQKIENNLKGIQGIDRYTSVSQENLATINIEVFRNADMDDVLQDVKNAVGRINSFPVGMEPAVVAEVPATEFAISFGINGVDDLKTLKNIAKNVENDLRNIKGISQISIEGYPEEEIVAYINEETMRTYGISFDEVRLALAAANIDVTAGTIKTNTEEIIIRLQQKEYYAENLQEVVVRAMPDGRKVKIRDIAEVKNTWAESPQKVYINGERSIIFTVNKILGENILDISDNVNEYVENFPNKYKHVKAEVLDDFTFILRQRIQTLIDNGIIGALLVFLSLALFLNIRLAFWVALSIPFSFLGMFLAGYIWGLTINVLSLFGSIVVVGILVDDGIVVAEQIYQNYEKGKKPFDAAIEGVLEVLPSVMFAVITTIVAFMPFFFLDGRQGASMKDLAFVVIFSLLFSLLESAIILPSHLAHSKALRGNHSENKFREKLNKILHYPRDNWYAKTLNFLIHNKYIVVASIISITIITVGGFVGGVVKTTFFPFIDGDQFEITLSMPAGTRENVTQDILDKIEKATWEVNEELKSKREDGLDVIEKTILKTGTAGGSGGPMRSAVGASSANQGTLKVALLNTEIRNLESYQIAQMIKEKVGPIYEAEKLVYGASSIFGKPVSIPLISPNLKELEEATLKIKKGLSEIKELGSITDNNPAGPREIRIKLKPKAYLLGLNDMQVASQIRSGFFGSEVQRLQRGDDEIKVWVKYDFEDRNSLGKFEDIRIRTNSGGSYPLTEIAEYSIERGTQIINHIDGKREITVEADLSDLSAQVPLILQRVNDEILDKIFKEHPTVTTTESGQQREIRKMGRSSRTALSLGFIIVFFLIVLSFRSYMQAMVVISLLPIGLIGAVWGHWANGVPLNIMSAYGLIALFGIIVNDSIVYTNTFNGYLVSGMSFKDAIYKAGINRFRPILLTTLTTVLGLLPLLAETSLQAQFLIPMAISVSYGLMFGTVATLVILPIYLMYLNKFRVLGLWLWEGKKPTEEEVEPAIKEVKLIHQLSDH